MKKKITRHQHMHKRTIACLTALFLAQVSTDIFATESEATRTAPQVLSQQKAFSFSDLARTSVITLPNLDYDTSVKQGDGTNRHLGVAEFVTLSLQNSPQVRQARAQFETSQARVGSTRADLLPNASLRIAKGPEESLSTTTALPPIGSDRHRYATSSYRITQPIFNAPAFKEFDSSRQAMDASSLRLDAVREATALSATRATIDLSMARLTVDFADEQIEQLNKILSYLEARASAGASSQADLERARTRVLNAKQTRLEQQTNYRNAILELTRLTGSTPESLQLPSIDIFPALPESQEAIRKYVADQNFELLALRKDIEAQKKLVTAEYSRYLPVLGISLEKDTTENVRGTNSPWTDTRALVVMNWGFSLAGKEYYGAQQAAAELRNREAKFDDESQRTQQATEIDLALLQSTALRLQAAQAEQTSAISVVNAVEAQLTSGRIGSLLEALDASERLFGARFRLIQALGQQMKAHAQLLSRLGLLSNVQTQAQL